jgi:hypothetical protein
MEGACVSAKFSPEAAIIPRSVKRLLDGREEARLDCQSQTALLSHGGRRQIVRMVNCSRSGAMVIFAGMTHIGDPVRLQLLDRGEVDGAVRWARDGRIGIQFTTPLD